MKSVTVLHQKALGITKTLRNSDAELLGVLVELYRCDGFLKLGYPSCFVYCRVALSLSDCQSRYFAKVARKSLEVPRLKAAIESGRLTVSQARRIVPVVTKANLEAWVTQAAFLPQKDLEKKVRAVNPRAFPEERVRVLDGKHAELTVVISDKTEARLRRAQDVLARKNKTTDELLFEALGLLLKKHDPIEKAKRAQTKSTQPGNGIVGSGVVARARRAGGDCPTRWPEAISVERGEPLPRHHSPLARRVPSATAHPLNLRDLGRCQERLPNGEQCPNTRYTEIHHILPWSLGGKHTLENLITLCSAHHRARHPP